jgi:hypothetical protein
MKVNITEKYVIMCMKFYQWTYCSKSLNSDGHQLPLISSQAIDGDLRHFQPYFSYIVTVSFIEEKFGLGL